MKKIQILVFTFIILYNAQLCFAQINEQAVKLNNEAMALVRAGGDIDVLKAIKIIDQAILMDSSYYMAYINKSNLLCRIKDYNEAINSLNKAITIRNNNFVEAIMSKGFILEKVGRMKEANESYSYAMQFYNRKIKLYPDSIQMLLNRAFTMMFLYSKEKGISEYRRLREKYPNDTLIKNMHDVFFTFNRKNFIDDLFK